MTATLAPPPPLLSLASQNPDRSLYAIAAINQIELAFTALETRISTPIIFNFRR
ncbi:hypothetical protein [Geminisphaera colitermitum]|uniref:hypothetical protein n=1 Tax=Geminisphaera colitermitum TaxID=1148786 RepID=UPI0012FEC917|nr:hypothetical protein [Geminisphaera colitermitum]